MARAPNILGALQTGASTGQQTPYQRIDLPGAAFGTGTGAMLQGFAQDIERVGAAFEQSNRLANESTARDAITAYREQMISAWGEYAKLNGRAAVEGFDPFKTSIRSARDAALASLPNDQARMMAQAAIDGAWLDTLGNATTYSAAQDRAWSLDSSKASATTSMNLAAMERNDFFKVHEHLDQGAAEILNAAEIQGDPPEMAAVKVAEYYGEGYKVVIANLMQDDPLRAEALFQSVENKIDPVTRVQIMEQLKPKVIGAKADAIVAAVTLTASAPNAETMTAFKFFVDKGYSTHQAAALVGNLMQESGASLDPNAVGDNGTAFGIAQWRGDRLKKLQLFAEANGLDYKTREAQLQFMHYELQTDESAAGQRLRSATTLEDANDAVLGYERPQGWTAADPTGSHARDARLANAYGFMAPLPNEAGEVDPFDPDKARARVAQMAGGDVELTTAALTKLNQQIMLQDIALAQRRQQMAVTAKDTETALWRGEEVTIPIAEIEALYPKDEADRLIGSLTLAHLGGQFFKANQFASPGDMAAMRDDLVSGIGMLSGMVRESFGAVAGEATDIAMRGVLIDAFDKMAAERAKKIADDPATYSLQDPGVTAAVDALNANPSPEAWIAYATAQTAVQDKLGIFSSDQRLLTKQMTTNAMNKLSQGDPKGASDYLLALQNSTGDLWPQVFGELEQAGLPGEYLAIGLIQDPVARVGYTNALLVEKDAPGVLRKALGDTANDFDEKLVDAIQPFLSTLTAYPGQGNIQQANKLTESIKLLAYAKAPQLGADAAIQFAVQAVTGQFDVSISDGIYNARAPKGLGAKMEVASDAMRYDLAPEDLKLLPNRSWDGKVYTPEEQVRITVQNARNGVWVTSPADDGWVLMGADDDIVYRADGSPVLIKWGEADALAEGRAPLTPSERIMQTNKPVGLP